MQSSFFDLDDRYAHLSKIGDPLERLSRAIDWELFRPLLDRIDDKPRKNNAGRKPTDRVLMFKLTAPTVRTRRNADSLAARTTARFTSALTVTNPCPKLQMQATRRSHASVRASSMSLATRRIRWVESFYARSGWRVRRWASG